MSTAESREENVYSAKVAEMTARYEEMVELMDKVVIKVDAEGITVEERTLLSVAYKNVIGPRRTAWRIIAAAEPNEEARGNEDRVAILKNYRSKIETEIRKICDGILNLLDSHLVPAATTVESKVFYLKMKGDYQRYLAEIMTGTDRKEAAKNTLLTYKSAQDIAVSDLASFDPDRLGLALNFSVFYHEILKSTDKASNLAKQAYDEATTDLGTLDEETYKESKSLMQLLRDNWTLWASLATKEGAAGAEETAELETTEGQL